MHEVSSLDSPMHVHGGAEDKEEEAATEDSTVEQEEEKEEASVWEVNDSSTASPTKQHEIEEEVHSQFCKVSLLFGLYPLPGH